jgi:hypothetical protein
MKRHSILIATLLLTSLLGSFVQADTVTIGGTNPTTNTDNTAIPSTGAGSLVTLRIEYGTCSAANVFGTKAGEVSRTAGAPGAQFTHTINLNPGTTCVRAAVSNTFGTESAASNVVSKVVSPPTPRPPQLATIEQQVFDVRPNEQTFSFDRGRYVGTVRLGAACDEGRTTGANFYALERPSRVRFAREPRSAALVAKCG